MSKEVTEIHKEDAFKEMESRMHKLLEEILPKNEKKIAALNAVKVVLENQEIRRQPIKECLTAGDKRT